MNTNTNKTAIVAGILISVIMVYMWKFFSGDFTPEAVSVGPSNPNVTYQKIYEPTKNIFEACDDSCVHCHNTVPSDVINIVKLPGGTFSVKNKVPTLVEQKTKAKIAFVISVHGERFENGAHITIGETIFNNRNAEIYAFSSIERAEQYLKGNYGATKHGDMYYSQVAQNGIHNKFSIEATKNSDLLQFLEYGDVYYRGQIN